MRHMELKENLVNEDNTLCLTPHADLFLFLKNIISLLQAMYMEG
jgi:hypothetical protein